MDVIVKEPGAVEHKGKIYRPGDPLTVSKEDGERLLAKGKVEPAKETADKPAAKVETGDKADPRKKKS